MKLVKVIIDSNIFISVAAVFLALETQIQLGMKPQWHPYLFIIFFATLCEYNVHRLITIFKNKQALRDRKHHWVEKYPRLFYGLVVFSCIGCLIAVLLAKKEVLLALAPYAIITLFYSLPIFRSTNYLFRLRDIPFIKIFLIALVWSSVTIMLPIIQSGITFDTAHIAMLLVGRFIFVFSITLPFDVRDIAVDQQDGVRTIPQLIGAQNSIKIALALQVLFMLICVVNYRQHNDVFILVPLMLSGVTTCFFIQHKKLRQQNYYHYGILDGTMLLQGLLVYAGYYMQHLIFRN